MTETEHFFECHRSSDSEASPTVKTPKREVILDIVLDSISQELYFNSFFFSLIFNAIHILYKIFFGTYFGIFRTKNWIYIDSYKNNCFGFHQF